MTRPFPRASRLGFGCASLGSRVGARQGLRSLSEAHEAGVNWFDVAPSYGDGHAEALLGEFARSRRDQVHICTKCGIAPPAVSPVKAALRPLSRLLVKHAPGLRSLAARGRGPAERQILTYESVIDSLERSLVRLGTDYVDVLALHDPGPDDLENERIARALEDVVTSGKARVAGIAGSPAAAVTAFRTGLPVAHLQFAADGLDTVREGLGASAGNFLLATHSVLGGASASDRAARLGQALASNADGVVVVSMFGRDHLLGNLAVLAAAGT